MPNKSEELYAQKLILAKLSEELWTATHTGKTHFYQGQTVQLWIT